MTHSCCTGFGRPGPSLSSCSVFFLHLGFSFLLPDRRDQARYVLRACKDIDTHTCTMKMGSLGSLPVVRCVGSSVGFSVPLKQIWVLLLLWLHAVMDCDLEV